MGRRQDAEDDFISSYLRVQARIVWRTVGDVQGVHLPPSRTYELPTPRHPHRSHHTSHCSYHRFTFRPHADWLCFSVEAQGRTIDFAAQQDAEVCSWVVGLTALLREQTNRDSSYATNQHGVQV